jgi:hypothetical protein
MSVRIFHRETSAHEEWLDVNDDETVTYHVENSGWNLKAGIEARDTKYSIKEAKVRWPSHVKDFDKAVEKIRASR